MPNSLLKSVRNAFLAGVIVLAPLGVTLIVFSWLVEQIGGRFRPYFFFFLPDNVLSQGNLVVMWNLFATAMVLLLVTVLGVLSRYVFGRYFINGAERLVANVPVVNAVYRTVKQIVDTFSSQNRAIFSKVVLVEFPRKGVYALGFLTSKAKGEPQAVTEEELWNVFVPTTPNPTSGFLIMLPKDEIRELQMTIGEGMKIIISGGAVVPIYDKDNPVAVPVTNPEAITANPAASVGAPTPPPPGSD